MSAPFSWPLSPGALVRSAWRIVTAFSCATAVPASLAAQALRLERTGLLVGSLSGPGATFGEVTDAVAIPSGTVILDGRLGLLLLLDSVGTITDTLATSGSGPGELVQPRAIAAGPSSVVVLDPAGGRLTRLTYNGRSVHYDRQDALRFTAFDICSTSSGVVVLGTYGGKVLHVMPYAAGPAVSFGPPWGPRHPLLERSLSRGFVACSHESNVVLAVSSLVATVRAFRTDGTFLWERALPDFRAVKISPNRDGSVTYGSDKDESHDVVVAASAISGGYFLVQYGRLNRGARSIFDVSDTRSVILSASGHVGPVQQGLPRILSVAHGVALAARDDPFPVLEAFRLQLIHGSQQ